jgi:uncharacterized protein
MLIDAGPLIAIIDAKDPFHRVCVRALNSLSLPFHTSWPVLTEVSHFITRRGTERHRKAFWKLVRRSVIVPHELTIDDVPRIETLMHTYADQPMDLGDASLVVLAERLGMRALFTIDSDFSVYRINGRRAFEIVPLRDA